MNTPKMNRYQTMTINDRRHFLADRVSQTRSELSEEFLLWALDWEQDPKACWFLVKAAGILKLESSIPLLTKICQQPDVDFDHTSLHAICAWSFGRIGNSATNAVMKLLNNKSSETRRCAADALGEIRASAAISGLILALRNDDRQVKLWAGLSLAKIGAKSAPFLERVALDADDVTRLIALDALKKIADMGAKTDAEAL